MKLQFRGIGMRFGTAFATLVAVLVAAPVAAQPIGVDQSNSTGTETNDFLFSGAGQSFQPNLSSIDTARFLLGADDATLQATLYNGVGITGVSLATSNIVALTGGTFRDVPFSFATTALTPGNDYTLFVRAVTGAFGQTYGTGNPYANGAAVTQSGSIVPNVDFRFAEGAAAVPEPATWAMMVVGLGAIGFAVRRRRLNGRVPSTA